MVAAASEPGILSIVGMPALEAVAAAISWLAAVSTRLWCKHAIGNELVLAVYFDICCVFK
jgi:hypothetical protein